ncbi:MAG: hypothetical protein ABJF88_00115 [Rhodothermales bacterium]
MRKSLLLALLVAFALPMTANRAEAQFSLIPYLGYNLDAESFLVGIGTELDAPFSAGNLALGIRPSIEYLFIGDENFGFGSDVSVTALQINGDVIARLESASLNPFVGAGLAILSQSFSFDCEGNPVCEAVEDEAGGTEVGLNIVGGLEFDSIGFGAPFVQGRLTLLDGSAISILGGFTIPLGAN